MSTLYWDKIGDRIFETGVDKCVLYLMPDGEYMNGIAWSGIMSVSQNPSGAEATAIYANNKKYLNILSSEDFGAGIEAYTYPEEFSLCEGYYDIESGITFGQQERSAFGLCYRTLIGNDSSGESYGYQLHLVYGCTASPTERGYGTISDSPEPLTFSWELSTNAVEVEGFKPTAHLFIDSTTVDKQILAAMEKILYGTDSDDARFMLPDEVIELFATYYYLYDSDGNEVLGSDGTQIYGH